MLRTEYDDGTKSPLQRAFELAQSGEFAMASDIRKALAAEGYNLAPVTGRVLNLQLTAAIQKARVTFVERA